MPNPPNVEKESCALARDLGELTLAFTLERKYCVLEREAFVLSVIKSVLEPLRIINRENSDLLRRYREVHDETLERCVRIGFAAVADALKVQERDSFLGTVHAQIKFASSILPTLPRIDPDWSTINPRVRTTLLNSFEKTRTTLLRKIAQGWAYQTDEAVWPTYLHELVRFLERSDIEAEAVEKVLEEMEAWATISRVKRTIIELGDHAAKSRQKLIPHAIQRLSHGLVKKMEPEHFANMLSYAPNPM